MFSSRLSDRIARKKIDRYFVYKTDLSLYSIYLAINIFMVSKRDALVP